MSKRTSEANRAIALAWAKEKQLVLEGKGTRDWTPEQQQEILNNGKVYDDDGKALEGHHMKSVERFPEYQGNPDNIQFLSKSEHLSAHDDSFHNPTNGFYDPATGVTKSFGLDELEPCRVVMLTTPIAEPVIQTQNVTEDTASPTKSSAESTKSATQPDLPSANTAGFLGKVKLYTGKALGKASKFYSQHKRVIVPVVKVVGFIAALGVEEALRGNSKTSNHDYPDNDEYIDTPSANTNEIHAAVAAQRESVIERASPREHMVPAHRQRYKGEWKDKAPYPRGKKSE
jgi:hypothetical protein